MADFAGGDGAVRWDDDLPRRGEFFEVHSPTPEKSVRGLIIGHKVYGVWTHWDPFGVNSKGVMTGKTMPCTGTKDTCRYVTKKGHFPRWMGYLAYLPDAARRPAIAQVTSEAANSCPDLMKKGCNLRGFRIKVYRANAFKRAKVIAELVPPAVGVKVPPEFDVVQALYRLWGMSFVDLGDEDTGEES